MRREKRREANLARQNGVPSARAFGDNYHFLDDQGRQYMLAVRNGQVPRPQSFRPRMAQGPHECVIDASNWVTVYVRLPQGVDWFKREDVGRELILYDRNGEELLVRLTQHYRKNERRSGRASLSGLDAAYCNEMLNSMRGGAF